MESGPEQGSGGGGQGVRPGPGCPAGFALWDDAGRGFPVFWLRAKDLIFEVTALRLS